MGVDMYLSESGLDGKVLVLGRASLSINDFEMRSGEMVDCNPLFTRERARISVSYIGARIKSECLR